MTVRFHHNGADVSCNAWSPVTVEWGRTHPGASFEPRRLTCGLDGSLNPRRGDTLALDAGNPATHRWRDASGTWAAATGTWAGARDWMRLFIGRVTDRSTQWMPPGDGNPATAADVVTDVTALDPLADLVGRPVGTTDWPAESAQARARRIAAVTGMRWEFDNAPQALAARPAQAADALDLLDTVASWVSVAGGVWHDPATSTAHWFTDVGRTKTAPDVVMDACSLTADDARLVESAGDVTNAATVTYLDAGKQAQVTHTDPSSQRWHGPRSVQVSTELTSKADADALALDLVTRGAHSVPRWEGVTVRLSDVDHDQVVALLTLGPSARIHLWNMPLPAEPTWSGYVEGWRLDADGPDLDAWTLALTLSPAAWSGPLLTWAQVATMYPGAGWAEAQGTWNMATDEIEWSTP